MSISKIDELKKLANEGDLESQKSLAFFYEMGLTVKIDISEALRWWKKAALQGDEEAQAKVEELNQGGGIDITEEGESVNIPHGSEPNKVDVKSEKSGSVKSDKSAVSILIIDDDSDMCQLITRSCKLDSVSFTVANNAKQAMVELTKNPNFDAILLDIMLPGADGLQFLQAIRGHPVLGKIQVIVISGNNSEKYIIKAKKLGIQGWLAKPLSIEKLNNSLGKLKSLH